MSEMCVSALQCLFYPFERGVWALPEERVAFLNAQVCPGLDILRGRDVFLQQFFYPYVEQLKVSGYDVASEFPCFGTAYDVVFIALPKSLDEARYMVSCALQCLKDGGLVVAAAANDAGGGRIEKMFAHFGLGDVLCESKYKSKVCCARKECVNAEEVERALVLGSLQEVVATSFYARPGVYGWNKIDKGSQKLVQHLPDDLCGAGADFGCGYGYLSAHVLQNYDIERMTCLDADFRALEACEKNLSGFDSVQQKYLWRDLTHVQKDLSGQFDFIVMNPPFHEGKNTDLSIGKAFILSAADALKKGGRLYMVANRQLAYEDVLHSGFSKVDKLFEGEGFKVFCAVK
ncbi:MAG: class I SAM-dependent methyltransferase [Alphaproteobacteria bacterium]|nr:class I SAM-dependent methyltransferase [Alphaproteobacteria bacterium]